jgi:hypothetical protein
MGYLNTTDALDIARDAGVPVSRPTIITWCSRYGIGKKIGGRWQVDSESLQTLLEGNNDGIQTEKANTKKSKTKATSRTAK